MKITAGLNSLNSKFIQIFNRAIPILHKFFWNIEEVGTLSNLFYESNIMLIPKLGKYTARKRKLQSNISHAHACKNL